MQPPLKNETMISCRQSQWRCRENRNAFRPIGGGDKVLRVEMPVFAPNRVSLAFSAIGEMNK
jgi:hypothetical protein